MSGSLTEFRATVLEQLLELVWRQWSILGTAGSSQSQESNVVDPEALLLLSLTVARHDIRLFDELLAWLDVNGAFLNVQRLQNLLTQYDFQSGAELGTVADWLGRKSSHVMKWQKLAALRGVEPAEALFFMKDGRAFPPPGNPDPVFLRHGLLRTPVETRSLARPFPSEGMPALLLRLRALLGINIRCEILCLLGSVEELHPSEVARLIGHAPRTTQNALAEMARSGVVQMRAKSREKMYALKPGVLDRLLRPDGDKTPWINAAPLFRALQILWLGITDAQRQQMDALLLSSELRRTAQQMIPLLGDAGMGQPLRDPAGFRGETYAEVFFEDVRRLLKHPMIAG